MSRLPQALVFGALSLVVAGNAVVLLAALVGLVTGGLHLFVLLLALVSAVPVFWGSTLLLRLWEQR